MMTDYPAHGSLDWDVPLREYLESIQGRPTYAPDSSNPYDPIANVHNWKASNTRRARKGLGKAATDQISEFVVVGDSLPAGATSLSTWDRLHSWPMQMRDELARHGIPTAGTGLVRNNDNGNKDDRWGATGTWLNARKTYSYASANGVTATFTTNLPGDRVTIGYYDDGGGGTWTTSVNGVAQGTTTNSGPAGWKKVTFNAAIAAGQTVVITKTSSAATFIYLRGVNVWDSAGGLIVHNIAQGGSKAFGTSVTNEDNEFWADSSDLHTLGQVFADVTSSLDDPDCVIIALGANDKDIDTSDANITTALTTIRNRWPDSDAILIASTPKEASMVSEAAWAAFLGTLWSLADTLDIPLVDHTARLGTFAQITANGLNGDAQAHLKVEAYADLGRNLGQLLAA